MPGTLTARYTQSLNASGKLRVPERVRERELLAVTTAQREPAVKTLPRQDRGNPRNRRPFLGRAAYLCLCNEEGMPHKIRIVQPILCKQGKPNQAEVA